MRTFTLLFGIILLHLSSFSQEEIEYNEPPKLRGENYSIQLSDIIATAEKCKFKLSIYNDSENDYFLYKYSKVGFEYQNIGTYFPEKGKDVVILPGEKESKVVYVAKKIDYRVSSFNVLPQGLYSGKKGENVALGNLALTESNLASLASNGLKVECVKFTNKKGKVTIELESTYSGSDDKLILVSPNLISVSGIDEVEISKSDEEVLKSGDKVKLKIVFSDDRTEQNIELAKVFNVISLSKIAVNSIEVTNNQPTNIQTVNAAPNNCPPIKGPKDGSVLVKVYNEDGVCFKIDVDGFPVINSFTSNAMVFVNPGRKRLKFTFANGSVLEEKKYIPDTHLEMGFRIKEKGSGEYVLKSVFGDQVLTAEAKQESKDMMARTQQKVAEMNADHKSDDNKASSGGNSSSGTASSSSGSSCYGESSSGVESIKLKITWQGTPLKGYGIQVKNGTIPFGNNVTDDNGNVTIKVSSIASRSINVFGCKGSSNWSVTGTWVVLDNSNYFHLKLDEFAKLFAEIAGVSVSEIGKGWGL